MISFLGGMLYCGMSACFSVCWNLNFASYQEFKDAVAVQSPDVAPATDRMVVNKEV